MGQLKITRYYRCDEDCEQSGCKGHTAELHFNSVANIYNFKDGKGQELWMDINSAQILIDMFRFYSETRADTAKV